MSQIDLNRLSQFVKVVEAGNISRAAAALGLPKSVVSRNLALLEEELKQQLVYRTTRQFHLTESGRILFDGAKSSLGAIDETVGILQQAEAELSGLIRLTAPDDIGVYVLVKIIDEFRKHYPKVTFDIVFTDAVLDLVAEGIDVAIRIGHLRDSSLRRRSAGHIEAILVASPQFLDRQGRLPTMDSLTAFPTVGFGTKGRAVNWTLTSAGQKVSLRVKPALSVNNYIAVCDLVVRGHGIGYVPRFLCEPYLKSGELVHVLKNWRNEGAPVQVVLPGQASIHNRIKVFTDFCAKRLLEVF